MSTKSNNNGTNEGYKVFLGGLDTSIDEELIYNTLSGYKSINHIEIPRKAKTGASLGIGVLHLNSETEYQKLIEFGSFRIGGRLVKAHEYLKGNKLAQHKKNLERRRIYIKDIPQSVDDELLKRKLSEFGCVLEAYRIFSKRRNKKKMCNFGYAEFDSAKTAQMALGKKNLYFGELGNAVMIKFDPQKKMENSKVKLNKKIKKQSKKKNNTNFESKKNFETKKSPHFEDQVKKPNFYHQNTSTCLISTSERQNNYLTLFERSIKNESEERNQRKSIKGQFFKIGSFYQNKLYRNGESSKFSTESELGKNIYEDFTISFQSKNFRFNFSTQNAQKKYFVKVDQYGNQIILFSNYRLGEEIF